MKDKAIIYLTSVAMLFFFSYAYPQSSQTDVTENLRKIRIKWDGIQDASGYRVLIRDSGGNIIIDRETELNSIELEVLTGEYEMRIGTKNKFNKISSWSDWKVITVREPEKKIKKPEKEEVRQAYDAFKIGAGASYFYVLPVSNGYFNNSFYSGNLLLGYSLKSVERLTSLKFFRYTGIELESTYVKLEGKESDDAITINNTIILTCGNIYLTTTFNFPVNLILRAGGGVAYSMFQYQNVDSFGKNVTISSQDPFFKIGIAIEISLSRTFFIEGGANYYSILYIGEEFRTLMYFMRVGVRL